MKFNKLLLPLTLIASMSFSSGILIDNSNASNNENKVNITFVLENGAVYKETGLNTYTISVNKSLSWKYVETYAPTKDDILYEGYTLNSWQIEKEVAGTKTREDIESTYHFNVDTNLYASFKDAYATLTFALPDGETEYTLPSTSVRFANGTYWKDVKSNYEPRAKNPLTVTKYFNGFYNSENKKLGTDIEVINSKIPEEQRSFVARFSNFSTSKFDEDTWDVFIKACNKGYTSMSTTAEGDGLGYKSAWESNNNTFVGLTRTIEIAGKNYTVKVIDENGKDKSYADNKDTTLTFEFVDVISEARSYGSNFAQTNEWETSALRQSLNKGGDLFSLLPETIQNGIVPVKKLTYRGINSLATDIITTEEHLFPLSLKEIGFSGKIGDAQQNVLDEGTVYKAYQNASTTAHLRDKKCGSDTISYQLRSPQLDISVCSWYINSDDTTGYGIPKNAKDINFGLGVAPAFCIGVSE